MITLPKAYADLATHAAPRMLVEALKLYGTREEPGPANSPVIMGWARELNIKSYTGDITPWCGLFMAVVATRAGWWVHVPENPLWARDWAKFGQRPMAAGLGDVLVFRRPGGGGHVGVYVGEDATHYHVLGGNQRDQVNIIRILRSRLITYRRPVWRIAQPREVRPIHRAAQGTVSTNEA